jgi:hypothetical protein
MCAHFIRLLIVKVVLEPGSPESTHCHHRAYQVCFIVVPADPLIYLDPHYFISSEAGLFIYQIYIINKCLLISVSVAHTCVHGSDPDQHLYDCNKMKSRFADCRIRSGTPVPVVGLIYHMP